MKLWIFFGVITILDYFFWSFLYIPGLVLKVKYRIGIFLGLQIFYLWCMPDIFFFGGGGMGGVGKQ